MDMINYENQEPQSVTATFAYVNKQVVLRQKRVCDLMERLSAVASASGLLRHLLSRDRKPAYAPRRLEQALKTGPKERQSWHKQDECAQVARSKLFISAQCRSEAAAAGTQRR